MKNIDKFIFLGALVLGLIIFTEIRYNETSEVDELQRQLWEQEYATNIKFAGLGCKIKGGEWTREKEDIKPEEFVTFLPWNTQYGTCKKDGVDYFYQNEDWVTLEIIK